MALLVSASGWEGLGCTHRGGGHICHPMGLQGCPGKATMAGLQVPVHPLS